MSETDCSHTDHVKDTSRLGAEGSELDIQYVPFVFLRGDKYTFLTGWLLLLSLFFVVLKQLKDSGSSYFSDLKIKTLIRVRVQCYEIQADSQVIRPTTQTTG